MSNKGGINQKEYLKRYLCSDDQLVKKKKKKSKDKVPKIKQKTVKIIDDDASAFHEYQEVDESELYATNEEAPQIVGVIDERAPTVIMKQEYEGSGKWKSLDSSSKKKTDNENKRTRTDDRSKISNSHSDESPPRNSQRNQDHSPPRQIRKHSDESPLRNSQRNRDYSPPRRTRKHSDESPPRNSQRNQDHSPPRRTGKYSDESPPRKNQRNHDHSPPRRTRKYSDESPPRKNQRNQDQSPPRRSRKYSDESPPRKKRGSTNTESRRSRWNRNKSNDSDESPPRHIKREPADDYERSNNRIPMMPIRSIKKERASSSPDAKPEIKKESSKMTKTLDGKASGLQNAKLLKEENERHRARQEKIFKEMDEEMSGRNASLVIRDRKGRNKNYEKDLEKERRKMEVEEERKKDYDRWGKGLKQLEEIEKRRQEYAHEASKPLARAEDDTDLQDYLKDQERVDDPMLQYMRRKKKEEMKAKGYVEKPTYNGQFPDNRFNIRPGYRWDGVDRSNGYEKKYFSMINSKKSIEEEAYRYSTEDM